MEGPKNLQQYIPFSHDSTKIALMGGHDDRDDNKDDDEANKGDDDENE